MHILFHVWVALFNLLGNFTGVLPGSAMIIDIYNRSTHAGI